MMLLHAKAVRCRLLHGVFHCGGSECCRQVVLLVVVLVLVMVRHAVKRSDGCQ